MMLANSPLQPCRRVKSAPTLAVSLPSARSIERQISATRDSTDSDAGAATAGAGLPSAGSNWALKRRYIQNSPCAALYSLARAV